MLSVNLRTMAFLDSNMFGGALVATDLAQNPHRLEVESRGWWKSPGVCPLPDAWIPHLHVMNCRHVLQMSAFRVHLAQCKPAGRPDEGHQQQLLRQHLLGRGLGAGRWGFILLSSFTRSVDRNSIICLFVDTSPVKKTGREELYTKRDFLRRLSARSRTHVELIQTSSFLFHGSEKPQLNSSAFDDLLCCVNSRRSLESNRWSRVDLVPMNRSTRWRR